MYVCVYVCVSVCVCFSITNRGNWLCNSEKFERTSLYTALKLSSYEWRPGLVRPSTQGAGGVKGGCMVPRKIFMMRVSKWQR